LGRWAVALSDLPHPGRFPTGGGNGRYPVAWTPAALVVVENHTPTVASIITTENFVTVRGEKEEPERPTGREASPTGGGERGGASHHR
jgi:hypothetical protein